MKSPLLICFFKAGLIFLLMILNGQTLAGASFRGKPNIMWIVIEDASCHISCYGETAISSPNLDALAANGVRFDLAFTTAPVCSPSRSALLTGMYQTTSGSHNHRSQVINGKGSGNSDYYESYALPSEIQSAGKLFEAGGYYTCNENIRGQKGKMDYNFILDRPYTGTSWKESPEGIPFFAQIQLRGGKNRSITAPAEGFELPPYYADDTLMRSDWKTYLGSWLEVDREVGMIVDDLKKAGVYDNTLIVLFSDHGISHLRGKQFLYDEGTRIPLIIKLPNNVHAGMVREDMVKQIDILPTSLSVAGLSIPGILQGSDIFSSRYEEQEFVFTARDRCDETIDIIRSVRTRKYKYIRNFLSYRPHTQRNQYKDGKRISLHMRELYDQGVLTDLQARIYQSVRPPEEMYDLENDPFETENLADDPNFREVLTGLRSILYQWMDETRDAGLIPEPILENLGKKSGSKFTGLKKSAYTGSQGRLIRIIEAGEKGDSNLLVKATASPDPSERYWAVTWLGVNDISSAQGLVRELLADPEPAVRIASNLALYKIDPSYDPVPSLGAELDHPNLITGLYAMSAIEQTGIRNKEVLKIAREASKSSYEFTRRYGNYLEESCPNYQ